MYYFEDFHTYRFLCWRPLQTQEMPEKKALSKKHSHGHRALCIPPTSIGKKVIVTSMDVRYRLPSSRSSKVDSQSSQKSTLALSFAIRTFAWSRSQSFMTSLVVNFRRGTPVVADSLRTSLSPKLKMGLQSTGTQCYECTVYCSTQLRKWLRRRAGCACYSWTCNCE